METNLGMKELRKATGMGLKELSELVGKSSSYLSRIESGSIVNTSYETMLNIAKAIADTDAIKNGKIDFKNYNSNFGRLVLSCKYDELKKVYDYTKDNKEVEYEAKTIQYLNSNDLNVFKDLGKYRKDIMEYEDAKKQFIEMFEKLNGFEYIKECKKSLGETPVIKFEVPIEDIIKNGYDKFSGIVTNEILNSVENLKFFGTMWDVFSNTSHYGNIACCNLEEEEKDEEEQEIQVPEEPKLND